LARNRERRGASVMGATKTRATHQRRLSGTFPPHRGVSRTIVIDPPDCGKKWGWIGSAAESISTIR
jgi:hypothetical protein